MRIEKIKEIGILALQDSYGTYQKLGEQGRKKTQRNRFGEMALKADYECEENVIRTLKKFKLPIRVLSEEHGIMNLHKNPRYLGVLDGLDGSGVYERLGNKGRYGTMFAIFTGTNPSYSDYLFAGIMEHPLNRLFFAYKNKGVFLIENGKLSKLKNITKKRLTKNSVIYVDEFFEINKKVFSNKLENYHIQSPGASCHYYIDVLTGKADAIGECTRKDNLEIAVSFGLMNEIGGKMVTLDGESIGEKKILVWSPKGFIPVLTIPNENLMKEMLSRINKTL